MTTISTLAVIALFAFFLAARYSENKRQQEREEEIRDFHRAKKERADSRTRLEKHIDKQKGEAKQWLLENNEQYYLKITTKSGEVHLSGEIKSSVIQTTKDYTPYEKTTALDAANNQAEAILLGRQIFKIAERSFISAVDIINISVIKFGAATC